MEDEPRDDGGSTALSLVVHGSHNEGKLRICVYADDVPDLVENFEEASK